MQTKTYVGLCKIHGCSGLPREAKDAQCGPLICEANIMRRTTRVAKAEFWVLLSGPESWAGWTTLQVEFMTAVEQEGTTGGGHPPEASRSDHWALAV